MAQVLFLDDDPSRAERFAAVYPDCTWVAMAEECIARLASDQWELVWLDHDIGGEVFVDPERPDCGMEVVRFLARTRPDHLSDTRFVVHTHNMLAAPLMLDMLIKAGYECAWEPFSL